MIWELKSIGEFCKTGSGGTPSRKQEERYYGGTIPWVKSGELKESTIFETEEVITEAALAETSVKMIPTGALLVAMYGATIGRIATLGIPASSNQAVCHIIPDCSIAEQRYLFYALSKQVPKWLEQSVGGAQPNINQQIIRNTKIPLPPLEEQRRIAAILDKADAVRRKRKEAIALTEDLLRSAFLEMFGDPVTNPKYIVKCIRPFVEAKSGKSSKKVLSETPTEIPIYGGNGISGWATQSLYDEPILVFGRVGQQCGNTYLVKQPTWVTDNAITVKVMQEGVIDLSYLLNAFSMTNFSEKVKHLDLPFINQQMILDFPIAIPPFSIQQEFAKRVESIERLKMRYQKSIAHLENFFNSLLQRAFRGEL